MANAVLIKTSLPSINTKSHTRRTQLIGKHVQKSVRNHCIVNTLVNGGSNDPELKRLCVIIFFYNQICCHLLQFAPVIFASVWLILVNDQQEYL